MSLLSTVLLLYYCNLFQFLQSQLHDFIDFIVHSIFYFAHIKAINRLISHDQCLILSQGTQRCHCASTVCVSIVLAFLKMNTLFPVTMQSKGKESVGGYGILHLFKG